MPAEVETMTFVGEEPWHHLGVRLDNPATSAEAIIAAGLNWKVETVPILAFDELAQKEQADPVLCLFNQAVMRTSDRSILGVVGNSYTPVQNESAFEFFDSVVGSGQAIYHTAGSLKEGRRIWILAQLPGDLAVTEKDIINRYLLLTNTHDGTSTLKMFFTPVRVVCMNTLTWALHRGQGQGIDIRHTGSIDDKISVAKDALGLGISYYDELAKISQQMVKVRATDDMIDELLSECFPGSYKPDAKDRAKKVITDIEDIANNKNNTLVVGEEGTLWAYVNAVAEYTDHMRGTRATDYDADNNRLESIWFGYAKTVKQRAFDKGLQLMAVATGK
jgi:phage/plasmid-like protein (TIGR03299 family)